ncbi:MAG: 1-deoxy-D-xylulose-5-phosphate reductoisomerase [Bacteroidales bacterium]|nr:1-deoxy-D-xylulose-5-phosphate reductoisomerase [Bacteroidales bacterium]MCM1415587.1 1-deoxy-D-xylulose-5-phosphate reductoisomerase [bacterium]MCM1422980.1 1-deoxy-D-xylulose-5-phosphate reductoisomerase [bacterium]
MKKIGILGSTGSIGTQTLEIVRKEKDLQVVSLAANSNVELLEAQIREFKPKTAALAEEVAAADLRERVRDLPVRVVSGMDGLLEVSTEEEMDVLVTGIVGMIGIRPTIAAIQAGKDIALANKETLVTAGHIIMPFAREMRVSILPVDSEHSAVFQALHGENNTRVEKILLTASGGPFRGKTREELADMTAEDALKHPNWTMGQKVTIDSASLCNKGLEVMEAKWLFDVDFSQIEVLVHPQSILHSAVQFVDGAIVGQMGVPDMKLPIQYALFYPDRRPMKKGGRVDLCKLGSLTFEEPDTETFRGLALAYEAGKRGGSMPTVFNAANERAVSLFLQKKIQFLQIPEVIQAAMEAHSYVDSPTVEEILAVEAQTHEFIRRKFGE